MHTQTLKEFQESFETPEHKQMVLETKRIMAENKTKYFARLIAMSKKELTELN